MAPSQPVGALIQQHHGKGAHSHVHRAHRQIDAPEMMTKVMPRAMMPMAALPRRMGDPVVQPAHKPAAEALVTELKVRARVCTTTMTMSAIPVLNKGFVFPQLLEPGSKPNFSFFALSTDSHPLYCFSARCQAHDLLVGHLIPSKFPLHRAVVHDHRPVADADDLLGFAGKHHHRHALMGQVQDGVVKYPLWRPRPRPGWGCRK